MSGRFQPPSAEEMARRGLNPDGSPLVKKLVRARNADGTLKADNPSTPDVNEAWEEKPVKKKRGRPAKKKD